MMPPVLISRTSWEYRHHGDEMARQRKYGVAVGGGSRGTWVRGGGVLVCLGGAGGWSLSHIISKALTHAQPAPPGCW